MMKNEANILETLKWVEKTALHISSIRNEWNHNVSYSHIEICDGEIEIIFSDDYSSDEYNINVEITINDLFKTTEELVQEVQDNLDKLEIERLERIAFEEKRKILQKENELLLKKFNDKEYKEYVRLKKIYGK